MKNKTLIWGLIVVAAIGAWYFFSQDKENPQIPVEQTSEVEQTNEETLASEGGVIIFKDGQYSPSTVTIEVGERVIFKNEDNKSFWPATDLHPTHTGYPGSDINKCPDPNKGAIFDACELLPPGSEIGFTFNEAGTWGYHDHLKPGARGKIVVQ